MIDWQELEETSEIDTDTADNQIDDEERVCRACGSAWDDCEDIVDISPDRRGGAEYDFTSASVTVCLSCWDDIMGLHDLDLGADMPALDPRLRDDETDLSHSGLRTT